MKNSNIVHVHVSAGFHLEMATTDGVKVYVMINNNPDTTKKVTFTGGMKDLIAAIKSKFTVIDMDDCICQIWEEKAKLYRQLEVDDSIINDQRFNIVIHPAGKCIHPHTHHHIFSPVHLFIFLFRYLPFLWCVFTNLFGFGTEARTLVACSSFSAKAKQIHKIIVLRGERRWRITGTLMFSSRTWTIFVRSGLHLDRI